MLDYFTALKNFVVSKLAKLNEMFENFKAVFAILDEA